MSQHLHVVAFDLPYPPDYGGIIDIYYKIRCLSEAGVRVHLHYFRYGAPRCDEDAIRTGLDRYCETVNAYTRRTGILSFLSPRPYIVNSRRSDLLIGNLCKDDHPVLFEGLHTCYYLSDPRLTGRVLIYRESNIEHEYYRHLAKAETNLFRKCYFRCESVRLKTYEKVLQHASVMLAVSKEDADQLRRRFPGKDVRFVPSFHRDNEVTSLPGKGDYVLYHGNLSVAENAAAVAYLIDKVWSEELPVLVIAGKNPPERMIRTASAHPNVRIIANPDDDKMFRLIREAHVNLMVTFQPTGLKLKLLNALYNGRFCLVNRAMLAGTDLSPLCIMAETPEDIRTRVLSLFGSEFAEEEISLRRETLRDTYSNERNTGLLIRALRG